MEITVRDAVVDDAGAIAAVNLASWEAAYRGIVADAFLDHPDLTGRAARWRERIVDDVNPILVACDHAGVTVGYCSLVLPARDADTDSLTGEVGAIYVVPDSFRGGVGSAMLGAALDLMRSRDFVTATLWVLTLNARARTFYAGQGFSADGTMRWIDQLKAEEMRLRRPL